MPASRVGRQRRRRPRIAAACALVVSALVCAIRPVASQGSTGGLPVVAVYVGAGVIYHYSQCDGSVISEPATGLVAVYTDRGLEGPDLTVKMSYGGTLRQGVDFPESLSGTVNIPPDMETAEVYFHPTQPGTLTATIEPAATYVIDESRATATGATQTMNFHSTCIDTQEQVLEVGEPLTPVDLSAALSGGPLISDDIVVDGVLPPGLIVEPATQAEPPSVAGVATTAGTFTFTIKYCDARYDDTGQPTGAEWCRIAVPYRVIVEPTTAGTAGPPGPAPAMPVKESPTYTG